MTSLGLSGRGRSQWVGELAESVGADGFLGEPGEDGEASGVFRFHFVDVGLFAVGAG